MRPLSWLTPLVPSPPLVKPFSKEVEGCYAQDSLVRSYLLLRVEQFLNEYEAITTWGSVFSLWCLTGTPCYLVAHEMQSTMMAAEAV